MENWKVIAIAAGVGLAAISGVAVTGANADGFADRPGVGSSGVTDFRNSMTFFCGHAAIGTSTSRAGSPLSAPCFTPPAP